MKHCLCIIVFCLTAIVSLAQISSGGMPVPFLQDNGKIPILKSSGTVFYTNIAADTVYRPADASEKIIVAGNVCPVNLTPYNSGTVFSNNGYRIWRAGIVSKGAASIGVVFTEFDIPDGAKLFLYNPSQTNVIGSFSSVNNNEQNILPVQPLNSDTVIVEYQEPIEASEYGFKGKLKIGKASHNFMSANGVLKRSQPWKGITCAEHIELRDPENLLKNAVCMIYTTGDNVSWFSTGVLINNPDKKPYILSSYHCFRGSYAKTSVFYFQNHIPMKDVQGSLELSIAGGNILAQAQELDFALVQLNEMPPKDYRPYLAGWDANEQAGYNAPYKCVQHPNGDFTKIAFATQTVTKSKVNFGDYKYQTFWRVGVWSEGATQGGSSGCPLTNANGKIIGCLTGGSSTCDYKKDDYFWQLSEAWYFFQDPNKSLRSWLDPHQTSINYMSGADPYADDNPCYRATNIDSDDTMGAVHLSDGATGYQSGHNSLGNTAYAEHYTFDDDKTLYGVYVVTYKGKYNASHPVYVNIYEGGGYTPGSVIASAVLKPTDRYYNYAGEFVYSTTVKWDKRENYVRFDTPVNIGKDCFVGVSFDNYASPDTLAVFQTTNRASGNYAYYYNSGWKSFENYPNSPMAASLWIEPVVSPACGTKSDDVSAQNLSLFPNPVDLYINVICADCPNGNAKYMIEDEAGRVVSTGKALITDGYTVIGAPISKGFYTLILQTETLSHSYKFIKK